MRVFDLLEEGLIACAATSMPAHGGNASSASPNNAACAAMR